MRKPLYSILIPLFLLLISSFSSAADSEVDEKSSEMEGINIIGSSEQPQVLYIVPWQSPVYQNRGQHPPSKTLSGILKPIEPVFHREDYYFRKKLEVNIPSAHRN